MALEVGSVKGYAPNFQAKGVNPRKDKVYTDPETGEKTTWKPGVIDPEAQKKNAARRAKVAGALLGLSTLAAAIFFRKPILKGIQTASVKFANFISPVTNKAAELLYKGMSKCVQLGKTAFNFVKRSGQKLAASVIKFFGKNAV